MKELWLFNMFPFRHISFLKVLRYSIPLAVLILSLSVVPAPCSSRSYFSVQVASLKRLPNAEKEVRRLEKKGYDVFYKKVNIPGKGVWYRIYAGKIETREKAQAFAKELKAAGITDYTMLHQFDEIVTIGVIDMPKILRQSKAGKAAQAAYLEILNAKRALFESRQKGVLKMEEKLLNEEETLSQSMREEISKKVSAERKDLIRLKNSLERELKEKEKELKEALIVEIRMILKDFAEKENHLILLEKHAVVVIDAEMDITDEIIQFYDSRVNKTF